MVACNHMGLGLPGRIVRNTFGRATGPAWTSQLSCTGLESKLDSCLHGFWGNVAGCTLDDAVAIECGYTPPASEPASQQDIWAGGRRRVGWFNGWRFVCYLSLTCPNLPVRHLPTY